MTLDNEVTDFDEDAAWMVLKRTRDGQTVYCGSYFYLRFALEARDRRANYDETSGTRYVVVRRKM